jgi:UDP-N-acetylmuramoyl-tripeptide--D-alanyl-D-alanine ligase
MSLHLDFVLKATGGKLLSKQVEIFDQIGTDTRKDLKDQLFIALKGDAFDAHLYLTKALDQGAVALMIHDEKTVTAEILRQATVILVQDTLLGLQALAHEVRLRNKATVIGIAGSNGKTTSKEFTAALLGTFRKTHFAKGSFNNHWGVPFTLLAQPEDSEVSVVEMGMNHKDELALLAKIAAPDIAVCTYVGVEHIEHFGTLEKIAEAEEEIYLYSPEKTTRIFNLDNQYTLEMYERSRAKFPKAKFLTFSTSKKADVQMQVASVTMRSMKIKGTIAGVKGEAQVEVFGQHNITNLMTAAASGLAAGLMPEQIWSGLVNCKTTDGTTWGRNQLLETKSGAEILFDAYNSNPDSMKALMENIALIKNSGKKIGVFAEMRELGDLAAKLHYETGLAVAQATQNSPMESLWFYGPHANDFAKGLREGNFSGKIITHNDFDQTTAEQLASSLKSGDIAIVKGSRGMELERFVRLGNPLNFNNSK